MFQIERLAAFAAAPGGGNPAGVVITDDPLPPAMMQEVAAEVGYSETAFLVPSGERAFRVRYFAPAQEVPFCGHATVAAGVALGGRHGAGIYRFATPAGEVPVAVEKDVAGSWTATLTSVEPSVVAAQPGLVDAALTALGWEDGVLDPAFPPAVADAGARHLVLVVRERSTLADLRYDHEALLGSMRAAALITVALLWREARHRYHARNAFPTGGVVEDPATGAAAAAFGAYLRRHGMVETPARVEILQGEDMGRPSVLHVRIPDAGGVDVSGTAYPLDRAAA